MLADGVKVGSFCGSEVCVLFSEEDVWLPLLVGVELVLSFGTV
jgi:hypothetical protein